MATSKNSALLRCSSCLGHEDTQAVLKESRLSQQALLTSVRGRQSPHLDVEGLNSYRFSLLRDVALQVGGQITCTRCIDAKNAIWLLTQLSLHGCPVPC